MSTQALDLTKQLDLRKQKVLDLKKSKGMEGQKAQVVLVLDHSGSMEHLYTNGKVQELVERLLPLGLAFDDNGEVDVYLFHNGQVRVPTTVTAPNCAGFVDMHVKGRTSWGGTNYAPVINQVITDFSKYEDKSGFLGMGKKRREYKQMDLPTYVIFITDGDNADKPLSEEAIREASKTGIFFQFVGIGSDRFPFLEKLDNLSGRNIDNANFFTVKDLSSKTDDELYNLLLTEFPSYVKEARQKALIK